MDKYGYGNCAIVCPWRGDRGRRGSCGQGRGGRARAGLHAPASQRGPERRFLLFCPSFAPFPGERPWDAPVTLGPGGGEAAVPGVGESS